MIARKLASIVIDSDHCLASQHLTGDHNDVADLLSFDPTRGDEKTHPFAAADPPNDILSHRFLTFLPQVTQSNFAISQLPIEILSFVTLVLQTAESSMIRKQNNPTKNATGFGDDGLTSATPAASEITPTSLEYPQMDASFSADPSYPLVSCCLLEPVRRAYWRTYAASSRRHCPRCRKPAGCGVLGRFPTEPLSRREQLQAPPVRPIPTKGL
jgi:hypothetical protein